MKKSHREQIDHIFKRVFGHIPQEDPEYFFTRLLSDVSIPVKKQSIISGKDVWTSVPDLPLYADQAEVRDRAKEHDWLYPKETIRSLDELMGMIKRADFIQASRLHNEAEAEESDDVSNSRDVFRSQNVINSSKIFYCSWIWDSENLFGCTRSGFSTNCIGLTESVYCADSYRVYDSHKVTSSMFIKSSYDVEHCLFSSHLRNKKFCIANMQYTEEEYKILKEQILEWLQL